MLTVPKSDIQQADSKQNSDIRHEDDAFNFDTQHTDNGDPNAKHIRSHVAYVITVSFICIYLLINNIWYLKLFDL